MRSHIQFVVMPTADASGTLLMLYYNQDRYLIGNFPEGIDRCRAQTGISWRKVNNIFLTGKTEWSNIGGLMSVIATFGERQMNLLKNGSDKFTKQQPSKSKVVDSPSQELNIMSPPNLNYAIAAHRNFLFRLGLPLSITEFKSTHQHTVENMMTMPDWQDENIQLWAISTSRPDSAKIVAPAPDEQESAQNQKSPKKRKYDEWSVNEDNKESQFPNANAATVVKEMFDSEWHPDNLEEMLLSQVKMPAKVYVRDVVSRQLNQYKGPLPSQSKEVPDIKVLIRKPWPATTFKHIQKPQPSLETVSYYIRGNWRRGKFLPEVADALGITIQQRRLLSSGESVTNKDGRRITPDLVMSKGSYGAGVLIADLSTPEDVHQLLSHQFLTSTEVQSSIGAYIWILGSSFASYERLHEFILANGNVQHIISSKESGRNFATIESLIASTIQLSIIDPKHFKAPVFDHSLPSKGNPDHKVASPITQLFGEAKNVHEAKLGLKFHLEPSAALNSACVHPGLDVDKVEQSVSSDAIQLAQRARTESEAERESIEHWRCQLPERNAEFITLGTGSARPSKYRNVSATLLRMPGCGSYLLDCGEGTLGQLRRALSEVELAEMLRDLKMIWISHRHGDHIFGLVSVIREWFFQVHGGVPLQKTVKHAFHDIKCGGMKAGKQSGSLLTVMADTSVLRYLEELADIEEFGYSRLLLLNPTETNPPSAQQTLLTFRARQSYIDVPKSVYPALLGISDIQTVKVKHCVNSKAVVLSFSSGFKVAYSGDCRPSMQFAALARGATVLIHEATFDDDKGGDARSKRHSTITEALEVAAAMDVKGVILTHFSQRYPRIPTIEEGNDKLAKDNAAEKLEANETADSTADSDSDDLLDPLPESGSRGSSPDREVVGQVKFGANKFIRPKNMKVCLAFDFMRFKAEDIIELEKLTPAIATAVSIDSTGMGLVRFNRS